jgi:outer membrane protein assembly factor BamB
MRSQITNSMPRLPLKGPKFRLALGRDTAFLAYEDGQVSAINTNTGRKRWSASVQGLVTADPVYANGEFLLVMTDDGKVTTFSADSGTRLNVDDPHGDSSTLEKAPSDRPEIIRNYGDFYALTPDGLLYSLPVRSH